MSKIGIDVSSYQGLINWFKVKAAGIEYAILKVIRKDLNPDKQFENNLKGCIEAGVPIQGVYNYSYATTVAKAVSDARRVIEVLEVSIRELLGISLQAYIEENELTVWLDVEDDCQEGLGNLLIDIINAYAAVIKGTGLKFGVYTGQYFYNTYIKPYGGISHCKWIARYGKNDGILDEKYKPNVTDITGWQFTSRGSVEGIQGNVDMNIWYDEIGTETQPVMSQYSCRVFVDKTRSFLGVREGSAARKEIIDIYNAHRPLARGYVVKYHDSWCATFVSAMAILCGLTDIIPTECSCQKQIELFKALGVWEENGTITPQTGDIIYYNWNGRTQPNDGWADHVGIVENVTGSRITVIEGNYDGDDADCIDGVEYREIPIADGRIRGYARPAFKDVEITEKKTIAEVAREVINGIWKNGTERKERLEAAGYDYAVVQAMVNSLLKAPAPVYHEVRRGEYLSGIAKLYETTVSAIVEMNTIPNINRIYPGQKIRVR